MFYFLFQIFKSHNEYSTYLSSACESSAAGTSSDGAENLIALATKIEKSKKRKSILSTPSESFTAMSAGDDDNSFEGADEEDDDELNEFRKWNLNEKISDMNTYNADFVRFFDAKGKRKHFFALSIEIKSEGMLNKS